MMLNPQWFSAIKNTGLNFFFSSMLFSSDILFIYLLFSEKAYKNPLRHISGEINLSCMSASLPKRNKATI